MHGFLKTLLVIVLASHFALSGAEVQRQPNQSIAAEPRARLGHSVLQSYLANINKGFDYLRKKEISPSLNNPKRTKEIIDLLIAIRKKEELFPDKYQVVTSQDSRFFAYQVIAKELYQQQNGSVFSDFEFLRYPNKQLAQSRKELFAKYPTLNLTKEQAEELRGIAETEKKAMENGNEGDEDQDDDNDEDSGPYSINDTKPEISGQLVAANLSMETCLSLDSALFVFVDGKGVVEGHKGLENEEYVNHFANYIRELFQNAGIAPEIYEQYIPTLIYNAPITKEGIVDQIFLPKERVQEFLYMSTPGGFLDLMQDEKIHEIFASFQSDRLRPSFKIDKNIQVRLIAGTLFNQDVKIFRHTLIPKEEQKNYILLVQEIVKQILITHNNHEVLCIN